MKHVLYALFDDPTAADTARPEIEAVGDRAEHCRVITHRGTLSSEELDLEETGTRQGLIHGILLGGALGALVGGVVVAPLGLVAAGPLAAALVGGLAGSLLGGVTIALVESGSPERRLDALGRELRSGKVLLTIEAPTRTCQERAEIMLRRHGARVVHRAFA